MAEQSLVVNQGKVLVNQAGNVVEIDIDTLMQKLEFAGEDGQRFVGRCSTVASLRNIEPKMPDQRIDVKEYAQGFKFGGGYFVYDADDKTTKDDGGYCFVTKGGARWKRALNSLHELNICHFGAIADGKTDCADAFAKMMAWSQANIPSMGVQFASGTFKLSGWSNTSEIARFRVAGAPINADFGYFAGTTIVSDNDKEGYIFNVVARRTVFANLSFEGAVDPNAAKDKKVAGKRGFYNNTCPGGQYLRVSNWISSFVGGITFNTLDALDTKLDQFYPSNHTNIFINGGWSGQTWGVWDHQTAIELRNFNVQGFTGPGVFILPRATQSLIYNGWIEHTENPGNLSDGHWTIDNFSMESCTNKMQFQNCVVVRRNTNLQGNSGWDKDSGTTNWTGRSGYEWGSTDLEFHGIRTEGSVQAGYYATSLRMDNNSAGSKWFKVGVITTTGVGENVQVVLQGTRGYNSVKSSNQEIGGTGQARGAAIINIKTISSNYVDVDWDGEGACPVKTVMFTKPYKNVCHLYVELYDWTRYVGVEVSTTSKSHFEAGTSFQWKPDGSPVLKADGTAAATADVAAMEGMATAVTGLTLGTKNGIGWNGDGELLLKFALNKGYLPVKITDPATNKVTQGYIKVETSLPA